MTRFFLFILLLAIFGCASNQKAICNYSTGNPNARNIVVGSCFHTDQALQDATWVDPKEDHGKVEQGHFVIDTVPNFPRGHYK